MAQTHDHEMVSIYPFTDEEIDQLMNNSVECVLMWATKDGWPVGVTHAFVWHDGKIWITFSNHRHRAAAIRRDNRVSVNVSSHGYPQPREDSPQLRTCSPTRTCIGMVPRLALPHTKASRRFASAPTCFSASESSW